MNLLNTVALQQPYGSTFWQGNLHIDTWNATDPSPASSRRKILFAGPSTPTSQKSRSPPSMMSSPEKKRITPSVLPNGH
ncbi:hypothetical protein AVEN_85695-1 [Araneus ventricosus]|uniref:Uncharacterized protein n=1 Tax=Araneus ventricosus TaxID=182803 RepID=A0A4Y2WUH0_ARAVE|nr:hypothetical protein AVEN_85695-1 [Araneus ventricosus]